MWGARSRALSRKRERGAIGNYLGQAPDTLYLSVGKHPCRVLFPVCTLPRALAHTGSFSYTPIACPLIDPLP